MTATRSRRQVRFQLTKEQDGSCQALGHRIAELMPEPFKNHASRTSRLRRCYASLTQNLERLQDGISDSGSEEQALKNDHSYPQKPLFRTTINEGLFYDADKLPS